MIVRQLKSRDAAIYRTLRLEALRNSPSAFCSSFTEERKKPLASFARKLSTKNVWIFGAFKGDSLVGTLGFSIEDRAKLSHVGLLFGMYVSASFRRQGFGAALVDAAIAHGERQSVRHLKLSVISGAAAARRFYASRGFETFGLEREAVRVGREYLDEEYMLLRLSGRHKPGRLLKK